MPEPTDIADAVRGMVEAAGLPVSEEELEGFIAAYPIMRAAADSLEIEELRYEEPGLAFMPLPPVAPGD